VAIGEFAGIMFAARSCGWVAASRLVHESQGPAGLARSTRSKFASLPTECCADGRTRGGSPTKVCAIIFYSVCVSHKRSCVRLALGFGYLLSDCPSARCLSEGVGVIMCFSPCSRRQDSPGVIAAVLWAQSGAPAGRRRSSAGFGSVLPRTGFKNTVCGSVLGGRCRRPGRLVAQAYLAAPDQWSVSRKLCFPRETQLSVRLHARREVDVSCGLRSVSFAHDTPRPPALDVKWGHWHPEFLAGLSRFLSCS